jgi:hypothetical protein
MNKIAEKILPMMTQTEVRQIVADHYRSESQTLSKAAEANLLKWRELTSQLDETGQARWDEIKRTFGRNLLTGGAGDDPVSRITGQLTAFNVGLERIERALSSGSSLSDQTVSHLKTLIEGLRAVPVTVDINVLPVERDDDKSLPVKAESTVRQAD